MQIIDQAGLTDTGIGDSLASARGMRGTPYSSDAAHLYGSTRVDVTLSATAAQSAALGAGIYDVWSTTDCYIATETTATTVTTANGYLLRANNTISVVLPHNYKVGGITTAAAGTLSIFKVR